MINTALARSWSLAITRLPQLSGETWPLPRRDYESEMEEYFPDPTEAAWLSLGKSPFVYDTFLQFIKLSEIIKDIIHAFYGPITLEEKVTPKKLDQFHKRLLAWELGLPDQLKLTPANTLSHSHQLQ